MLLFKVDGFTPIYICPTRTAISTRLLERKEDKTRYNRIIKECRVILENFQIKRKYKHPKDFKVKGNPCQENFELFKDLITDHMRDPSTIIKKGTFKKNTYVRHYFNKNKCLNVMIQHDNNTFLSRWNLTDKQLINQKNRGVL